METVTHSTKVSTELQRNRNKCKGLVDCLVQIQKMYIHHIVVAYLEMQEHHYYFSAFWQADLGLRAISEDRKRWDK